MGMSSTTGGAVFGDEYVVELIRDVLLTRIGTRPGRRDYGSEIPELIDKPVSPTNRMRATRSAVRALKRWVPSYKLERVEMETSPNGRTTFTLVGRVDGNQLTVGL
jgi:phage baseplate assembly protein W